MTDQNQTGRPPELAKRRISRLRALLVIVAAAAWIGGAGWRLYHLQVSRHGEFLERARSQQRTMVTLEAPRGAILDARGRQLAVSVKAKSLFAAPIGMTNPGATAAALAETLKLEVAELEDALSEQREFVWIKRKLTPTEAEAVAALDLDGLHFVEESRRHYPLGSLAGQVIGFVGTDHVGLAGLELAYNSQISGSAAPRSVLRDARRGTLVQPASLAERAVPGADLRLTLDATLQHAAEKALEQAVTGTLATAGSLVILDTVDSAVLVMASYPSFDPNGLSESTPQQRRNRAVMDAYEPGSTFKMVTASAAIDSFSVHPEDRFDCEMGGIVVDGVLIRDHKPFGVLTFREIIAYSSNVGVIKAASKTGSRKLFEVTRSFGFGKRTHVDLPGESVGILRPEREWPGITTAYAAFGHSLSVTPIQLANAYAALANGGLLHQPYVVRAMRKEGRWIEPERPPPERLSLARSTIQTVSRLLEGVVEIGTGSAADIDGYRVAGKTGTAEKSDSSGYSATGRIASFAGFVPARSPRLVALVTIDEPRGETGGGAIAAPVFSAVMAEAVKYLGIQPAPEGWEGQRNLLSAGGGHG